MSRVGKIPIPIPENVKVSLHNHSISVENGKNKLTMDIHPAISVQVDEEKRQIIVTRSSETNQSKMLHGLTRNLVANMIIGVTDGFSKELEVNGVGYSVKVQGRDLILQIGFCHPVKLKIPDGLDVEVVSPSNPGRLIIKGIDKQLVGQFTAIVRDVRPPEPYKGKGIKYKDEIIRRKAGKTFVSGE